METCVKRVAGGKNIPRQLNVVCVILGGVWGVHLFRRSAKKYNLARTFLHCSAPPRSAERFFEEILGQTRRYDGFFPLARKRADR